MNTAGKRKKWKRARECILLGIVLGLGSASLGATPEHEPTREWELRYVRVCLLAKDSTEGGCPIDKVPF